MLPSLSHYYYNIIIIVKFSQWFRNSLLVHLDVNTGIKSEFKLGNVGLA